VEGVVMLSERTRSYFAFLAIIVVCLVAALAVAAWRPMLRHIFPASHAPTLREIVKRPSIHPNLRKRHT